MKKYLGLFCFIFLFSLSAKGVFAQELNFSVVVSAPQLSITDPKVIKTLEKEAEEFLNSTKWTEDDFEPEERIEGNLLITITREVAANSFVADFTIQSIRPVFNSTYKTKLINYKDGAYSFSYVENQPIQNSQEKYFDNLSTILTFYANVVLGLDYDSFSKFGGEPYFERANYIVQSLPSDLVNSGNWAKTTNKISRYWLMENIYNPRMRAYREAMYNYHRRGLDVMWEDPGRGKAVIMSAMKSLEKVNDSYPNSMLIRMFGDSKNDEIPEIFQVGDRAEKLRIYEIMVVLDPYRANQYNSLRN